VCSEGVGCENVLGGADTVLLHLSIVRASCWQERFPTMLLCRNEVFVIL